VKRSVLGGSQFLFAVSASNDDAGVAQIFFDNSNAIRYGINSGEPLVTTAVYRDVSAWYHVLFAYDTTNATAADRYILYVNGVRQTTSTYTAPSQNFEGGINRTSAHAIGRRQGNNDLYFNGYLTNIHFIDGQALTPSSFTETDATTGQLVPKTYSGSYGTNGFNLLFADNSAATSSTLGNDSSSNNNDWTPNNLSVTAGAGNDSLVDSPTNYGTDTYVGGEVRGNYATWNPLEKAPLASLTDGNLLLGGTPVGNTGGTIAVSSGKWLQQSFQQ